jgi:hypothetical protein
MATRRTRVQDTPGKGNQPASTTIREATHDVVVTEPAPKHHSVAIVLQ